MVFIILFIIFLIFSIIKVKVCKGGRLWNSWYLFVLSLILLAILIPGLSRPYDIEWRREIVRSEKIIALQDTQSFTGSYFLGSGTSQNKIYYYYYIETDQGYKLEKISSEKEVYIQYITDESPPRIEESKEVRVKILKKIPSFWINIIGWSEYKDYSIGDIVSKESSFGRRYVIYVPKGSILEDYNIDLK